MVNRCNRERLCNTTTANNATKVWRNHSKISDLCPRGGDRVEEEVRETLQLQREAANERTENCCQFRVVCHAMELNLLYMVGTFILHSLTLASV